MGLFSRKDPDPLDGQHSRTRVPVSSEAQAAQWRARARRRLVGAVALVLAAVIVLPMVLDAEPVPVASDIPIVIPARNRPYAPQFADKPVDSRRVEVRVPDGADGASTSSGAASETSAPASPRKQTPAPESESARTDDGSRALALLEGRVPTDAPRRSASAESGSGYVLQIAAYGAQADAVARRDKLRGAGLGNAFVEEATVNGKPQYRLRVGPFPSREAAQDGQARLRALGYDNSFIAAQ